MNLNSLENLMLQDSTVRFLFFWSLLFLSVICKFEVSFALNRLAGLVLPPKACVRPDLTSAPSHVTLNSILIKYARGREIEGILEQDFRVVCAFGYVQRERSWFCFTRVGLQLRRR
eukprot:UN00206